MAFRVENRPKKAGPRSANFISIAAACVSSKRSKILEGYLKVIAAILRTYFARNNLNIARLNRPCFVMGSAPGAGEPPGSRKQWTFICVNASQAVPRNQDFTVPDITVMSDQMLGDKPVNAAAKEAIAGKGCQTLVLVKRGFSLDESRQRLQEIGYSWDRLIPINHWQRAKIVYRVTGKHLAIGAGEEKISTGFFAIFLAHYLGGSPIVVDGFSLSGHGHGYNQLGHRRGHIDTDMSSLLAMRQLPHVYTSNKAFAAESGLPVYEAEIIVAGAATR